MMHLAKESTVDLLVSLKGGTKGKSLWRIADKFRVQASPGLLHVEPQYAELYVRTDRGNIAKLRTLAGANKCEIGFMKRDTLDAIYNTFPSSNP